MTAGVLFVLSGALLLYVGAESLVRGASGLARSWGVAPAVIGLTVVALGTSAPELIVSATATVRGSGDIALGNVVGSNIANVGLILGLAAVIRPIRIEYALVRREVPLMIGMVGLLVLLSLDGTLDRPDGILLLVLFAGFLGWSVRGERRAPSKIQDESERVAQGITTSRTRSTAAAITGLAGVLLGGHLLVEGAVKVATLLSVPTVVIGLTVVAVGTSLPELAASTVAVIRGEDDIGVGNVVGSNLFNILGILGVCALLQPVAVPGEFLRLQYPVLAVFSLSLLPICRSDLGVYRWEGTGLLLGYASYVTWLFLGR